MAVLPEPTLNQCGFLPVHIIVGKSELYLLCRKIKLAKVVGLASFIRPQTAFKRNTVLKVD